MNNSIILDKEYQEKIKQSIQEIADINKDANPNTLWELIKGNIRNETIKYTSMKKRNTVKLEIQLKNEIDNLNNDLINNANNETILNNLNEKKMN